jgi:hydroxyethylthiazole kinase-like uncharacterized protein yjeF
VSFPLLSPRQMAEMDRRTIEELGVPAVVLMESAASACVAVLLDRWGAEARERGVCVLAGPGNNGGDGFAIARRLAVLGLSVRVVSLTERSRLGADAALQADLAARVGVSVVSAGDPVDLAGAGVIVDALFGTGLSRALDGAAAELVRRADASQRPLLAVDIPSGVDGGTGACPGPAMHATATVTFGAPKIGHFAEPGRSCRGALIVADIGIPVRRFVDLLAQAPRLLDAACLTPVTARADARAHKGTFGHLLVVAGGPGKVGAARLACEAALRAGVGLVTLALPEGTPVDSLASLRPEVMVARVPGEAGAFGPASLHAVRELLATRSALALGPGLGTTEPTVRFVRTLLDGLEAPCVVDADALNAMAGAPWTTAGPTVVTPHPGEASRLLDRSTPAIQSDRLGAVAALAALCGGTAVLKGAGTVVSDGNHAWINPSGNPGMGTAGSGDVLTGVVGALLARSVPPSPAACAAVYWHGLAGDAAAAAHGAQGMLASDLGAALGAVLAAPPPSPPWAPWIATSPDGWSAA